MSIAWFHEDAEFDEVDIDELADLMGEYFFERDNLDELYLEVDGEAISVEREILGDEPEFWSDNLADYLNEEFGIGDDDLLSGSISGGNYVEI